MTRNVSRAHPLHGILVFTGSRADMRDNVFEDNGLSGIVIDLNATVTLTNNLTQGNALDGLTVSRNAHATLTDIVSQNNGRDGIAIVDTAVATIHGGISTQNGGDGIRVGGGTLLPGRSTATLGLDDAALVEVSRNDGAGLLVVDDGFGSQATTTAVTSRLTAIPTAICWVISVMWRWKRVRRDGRWRFSLAGAGGGVI